MRRLRPAAGRLFSRPRRHAISRASFLAHDFSRGIFRCSVVPTIAGFWLRVAAAIIDLIILAIPLAIAVSYLSVAMGSWRAFLKLHPGQSSEEIVAAFGRTYLLAILCFFLVTGWLHFALFESSPWQGTVGKKFIGLSVADVRGNPVTFGRASGRFFAGRLLAHVPFIGSLYIAVDCICAGRTSRKQALHDMLSGCLVLRKNERMLYRE